MKRINAPIAALLIGSATAGGLILTDVLSLRTGNIKFPAGLTNEDMHIGDAMPWIQAPLAIYTELGAVLNQVTTQRQQLVRRFKV